MMLTGRVNAISSSMRRSRPTVTPSPSPSGSSPRTAAIPLWQRDLSISYEKVGDVLVRQGKLDEAVKAYRDSLAIREQLAAVSPRTYLRLGTRSPISGSASLHCQM